jgi:hypothetical protein
LPSQVVPDLGMPNKRIGARGDMSVSAIPLRSRSNRRRKLADVVGKRRAQILEICSGGYALPRRAALLRRRIQVPAGVPLTGVDDPAETSSEQRLLKPRIDDAVVSRTHGLGPHAFAHADESR